jgi:hypothetical protein
MLSGLPSARRSRSPSDRRQQGPAGREMTRSCLSPPLFEYSSTVVKWPTGVKHWFGSDFNVDLSREVRTSPGQHPKPLKWPFRRAVSRIRTDKRYDSIASAPVGGLAAVQARFGPGHFRLGRLNEPAGACGGRGLLWGFNCKRLQLKEFVHPNEPTLQAIAERLAPWVTLCNVVVTQLANSRPPHA